MIDVVLNKKESIERCIKQIKNYYKQTDKEDIRTNYMVQDAIAMNLQRICQACIDLANHMIRINRLGLPKSSADSFRILSDKGIISADISENLRRMTGFRNILVHDYQNVDINILTDIIEHHLEELILYTNEILKYCNE